MDQPTGLTLQDVRCFKGEQFGRLRPITLLVGENSTGKTAFLGCYAGLHRLFARWGFINETADFNEEPFAMGSFRDIVRSRRGPSGRINEFKLEFKFDAKQNDLAYRRLSVTFREEGSQPVVSRFRYQFSQESFLEVRRSDDNRAAFLIPGHRPQSVDVSFDNVAFLLRRIGDFEDDLKRFSRRIQLPTSVVQYISGLRKSGGRRRSEQRAHFGFPRLSELIPVAPLRSKPKRTYDPARETASPEGEHIPMLMMRLDRTEKTHWDKLHKRLVGFGDGSGLFSDIKVKRHGKQMSDPFQLQVKVRSGPHANIMDVGYGVSQSLPILVDIMAPGDSGRRPRHRTSGRTFLLQQPEVHLHPKGQAQLASLFIEAFNARRNRFLIETHSDYIVDRVRISVRQGLVRPEDVAILYFEPDGNAVTIHNISLDDAGNLKETPAGYREFFLKETDRLLGFTD